MTKSQQIASPTNHSALPQVVSYKASDPQNLLDYQLQAPKMNTHTTPTALKYAQHCNEQTPITLSTDIFYIPGPAPTGKVAIVTCMDARLG